ncbi:hypothetical protein FHETE_821 [Fusarium heterosporum]|uniref:Extracellular serine-rich protein n=1 Tax=Fusarium heterosporum TaxID=42747 RepID=A0A8H5TW18_FUSHE|nr:hypothetical protein FHETE_821 [Fusarium heterosporum]
MLPKHFVTLSSILMGCCAQETQANAPTGKDAGPMTGASTETPSSTLGDMSASTTSTTETTTHTINVGAAGHKFTPNEIKADIGDIIEYRFYPDAHWVIRGDYDNPCIPYEYVDTDREGFSSGPEPVKAITDDAPRYRVRVNDTKPIFFYCGAPGSCVRYHMMGVVNPSKKQNLNGWLKKADGVDFQLTPGEPFPKESGFISSTTSTLPPSTASVMPESTTSTAVNKNSSSSGHPTNNSLSGGVIAGIVIGSAAVLGIIIGAIYLCGRRGGFNDAYRKRFGTHDMPSGLHGAPPVSEVEVSSPNSTLPGYWVYKPTSPVTSTVGQSHHASPPLSPLYNFPQDTGAMMPPYEENLYTTNVPNFNDLTPHPPPRPPKEVPFGVAELPGQRLQDPPVELPYSRTPVE